MARPTLDVVVQGNAVRVGGRAAVTFQRTLRIPDDGRVYPLPPGLGRLPVSRARDFPDRVPDDWKDDSVVFVPMHQREALWIAFEGARWKPNAVQVGVGRVNAVSGTPWEDHLTGSPQNYLVCPDQPWIDGVNVGSGVIRQFVAMPLGLGYTVEAQVTGEERFGGVQIRVYEPKPGRFPDQPPPTRGRVVEEGMVAMAMSPMGLAAGGTMRQKIYPDPYGLDVWDQERFGEVVVHIVNSARFREITSREPPPSPIDAKTYTDYGFPWFDLYDEQAGDVDAPADLSSVKSVRRKDRESGRDAAQPDPATPEISPGQVKCLGPPEPE